MNEGIRKDRMLEVWDELEIPELGDEFFEKARVMPGFVRKCSVLLDEDVYQWLQEQPNGLERANQLLREHMLAERGSA